MLPSMPRSLHLACWLIVAAGGASAAVPAPTTSPSSVARTVNPDLLSGGLFYALDASGVFGGGPRQHPALAANANLSKGIPPAVLDARIGVNTRLGDDPAALPSNQRGQAEPDIYRSVSNPNVLLATFQDGRFSDAGSLDCGYSVSTDGGLTWTRALIPQLTTTSGGIYNRATDPVATIGPQGDLYLATLGSISGAFDLGAVVVSRSTDTGATWSAPAVVFQSNTTTVMPDKEWIAVNDYAGSPNAGRLVVTWTNFTATSNGTSTGDNIRASISDDRGATWSGPIDITPAGSLNQGSQPVFLPDGSLVVVYVTFANANTTTQFSIQAKRSADGGRTYSPAATIVASVTGWDDPDLRDGVFLPSATVARSTGDVFVTFTGVVYGTPRVLVTKSSDKGTTWTVPVVVSDNPAVGADPGSSVVNPAITATPDGTAVSVVFMDKRNATDTRDFIDVYAAQSFDGGVTWQPNVRLTEMSSDIRYAPQTTRGFMLGDYLGVAPALGADEPCVAIWCDTRTGDSDPFTVRFTPSANDNFSAWSIARFTPTQLASMVNGADFDNDHASNYAEYVLGTNPLVKESGEPLYTRRSGQGSIDVFWTERYDHTFHSDVIAIAYPIGSTVVNTVPSTSLSADQFPPMSPGPGRQWVGMRFTADASTPLTISLDIPYASGIPPRLLHDFEASPTAANTDARLINVSTRGIVGTGDNRMIVGYVLDGTKTLLLRAAGPALVQLGVSSVLTDPQLSLVDTGGAVASTNAAWQQSTATSDLFARLGAFPFPAGSPDAALVGTFGAGPHTAIISGTSGDSGAALVEAYDADASPGAPANPRVVNLSTRGAVGVGDANALIAGFVIHGDQPRRVLIRAVGPSLASLGVGNVLSDPTLTLYGDKTLYPPAGVITTNDDWEISESSAAIAATAKRVGAFALGAGSLDSALLITLPPGQYTAVVTGVNGATGIALAEVYDAD